MRLFQAALFLAFSILLSNCASVKTKPAKQKNYLEQHRPQFHFSPNKNWMNDPNGMVYHNGIYHLFFQYYPDGMVWGPMHWGHAVSKDLMHWEEKKIALYPDSLGYIFSGSAVVDQNNTTGFGKDGKVPLVAIFTHHDPKGEKEGKNNFETQSIAYSLDDGGTWIKYAGNPVLKNPGIRDFRDPKVMWFEEGKKWIMTLATKDRVTFYSSKNLKEWIKESEFGNDIGAHGGVWECPDLFPLELDGKTAWVLIVNINAGGPQGGSAGQYFVGDFDGNKFSPYSTNTKWIDFGADNYAGITWSNTGDRKIFLGWMSNWQYANVVPTSPWRSATTIPRELKLRRVKEDIYLAAEPVKEFNKIKSKPIVEKNLKVDSELVLSEKIKENSGQFELTIDLEQAESFSIILYNDSGEEVIIGFDKDKNQYFTDRSKSGKTTFNPDFTKKHFAPRLAESNSLNLTLIVDVASVELFADKGLTVMTDIFFPNHTLNKIKIKAPQDIIINKLSYSQINSIWR